MKYKAKFFYKFLSLLCCIVLLRNHSDSINDFSSSLCKFQSSNYPCIYIICYFLNAFPIISLLIQEKSWTSSFCMSYLIFHFGFSVYIFSKQHACRSARISRHVECSLEISYLNENSNDSTVFHTVLQISNFMYAL